MGLVRFCKEWWILLEHFTEKLHYCKLCPRRCGVDRLKGERGFCGAAGRGVEAARASLHMWEEPCISGNRRLRDYFFLPLPFKMYLLSKP